MQTVLERGCYACGYGCRHNHGEASETKSREGSRADSDPHPGGGSRHLVVAKLKDGSKIGTKKDGLLGFVGTTMELEGQRCCEGTHY